MSVTCTVEVTALNDDTLNDMLNVLRVIEGVSMRGMSKTIKVHVDGDGSGSVRFALRGPEAYVPLIPAGKDAVESDQVLNIGE